MLRAASWNRTGKSIVAFGLGAVLAMSVIAPAEGSAGKVLSLRERIERVRRQKAQEEASLRPSGRQSSQSRRLVSGRIAPRQVTPSQTPTRRVVRTRPPARGVATRRPAARGGVPRRTAGRRTVRPRARGRRTPSRSSRRTPTTRIARGAIALAKAKGPCDCTLRDGSCYEPGTGKCGPSAELNGAFCYPLCRAGYKGVGPVCWKRCPSGYKDDGALCRKDAHIFGKKHYGRGAGYPLWDKKKCRRRHAQGCVKKGLLWYPRCREGYESVGCCICRQKSCPAGYKDDGATCRKDVHIFAKKSYGRGAGYLTRADYRGIFYRFIRDHRNIYKARTKVWGSAALNPLPDGEKDYLRKFFPHALVEKVRVLEEKGMTGAFFTDPGIHATTYGNYVVIRKGRRDEKLLKHELVHVCQYEKFGVEGFSRRYADMYVDGGYSYGQMCFEQAAKDFETKDDDPPHPIGAFLGYCKP